MESDVGVVDGLGRYNAVDLTGTSALRVERTTRYRATRAASAFACQEHSSALGAELCFARNRAVPGVTPTRMLWTTSESAD
jgi:hypothetical protein